MSQGQRKRARDHTDGGLVARLTRNWYSDDFAALSAS